MSDGGPDLSVIVVTHESRQDIGACLESLRRHPGRLRSEVIVVDNASVDGTADFVASAFPETTLVRAPGRRGFSANCNDGVARSRGRYLLLLNPDAAVTEGAIDTLVEELDAHGEAGLVAPALVYPDGAPQPSARRFPRPLRTIVRRTPLRWFMAARAEQRHLMTDTTLQDVQPVDWVLGAALLLGAETLSSLGGFDEGYRLYCEDIDLCWRLWQRGQAVLFVPQAVVVHALGELTRKRFLTRATWWHARSMLRFVRLHGLRSPRQG
ncbi:MAG: glycosyltransferase family 2 protein [Acidimicrobiales bacterium]